MAKIEGRFATLNNTHTVKVCIYNKNLNKPNINIDASNSVKFSDNPVEITQQQDDTFEHILKTQCKIRLVTKEWLGDYLFAANYSSIVVNIWVDNDCVFCGYVVPHTYNQNYAHQWEEVEINCVDILSTLKDRRLTDNTTYEELVSQSTTRPFSWFLDQMDLDTTTVVIPNYPDIDYGEAEMMWTEIDWTRIVSQEGDITYYGVEAEVVLLDEDTAMNTGNTRQGQQKTPTWIESTDTCIVDGVSYYKEYAHITVNGEDVNTGDWRVGSNAGGMPVVVRTENRVDGWTNGVLPQQFDFYEHYTTYNIYDNGMEIVASDGIGEQIPLYPSTTTAGSYYEFRQGSADDVDVDEDTGYIYYKDYAWVCVNGTCENSRQWQRGNEKAHPTGTHTAITGWQYDNPPVPFEYYETISHYTDYSDGSESLDYTSMGHQIPLTPSTTTAGSYYEYIQGDADDLDVDPVTGYEYYKEYAWVVVNNVAEKTANWRRGELYVEPSSEYLTIQALNNGNIDVFLSSSLTTTDLSSFSYSKDKTNWTTWTNDEQGTNISIQMTGGEKLYLKGSGRRYNHSINYDNAILNITCKANIYGNIMSLLYNDNFENSNNIYTYSFMSMFRYSNIVNAKNIVMPNKVATSCYNSMFIFCSSLVNAPELPATTLATYCYYGMFDGCTSLINAPVLNATTLKQSSYQYMFEGCTSLTTAPVLPATTLATCCYSGMFSGCTSLTTAPELPVTTLASYCYQSMFSGCTSLTTAPELPATTLTECCYQYMFAGCTSLTTVYDIPATTTARYSCYYMFDECTSLINAPALPATTLGSMCYEWMFNGCTSLINAPALPATTLTGQCYHGMFEDCSSLVNAPELPATTLTVGCYEKMFYGCSSLTTAPELPATTLATMCYFGMFNGCTSLTTAPELPATTLTECCYQYMFAECTSLTTAPELPATTLASYCYQSMFSGCTSLTTAPELPATILNDYCYKYMFAGCTNLSSITMLATDVSANGCLTDWVDVVAASGTFTKAAGVTIPIGTSGIPSGWTVVDAA